MMLLDTLSEREKTVIVLRFGFDGEGMKTLEDVARSFNVTRERIRQIEAKAIRKLKHPSKKALRNQLGRSFIEHNNNLTFLCKITRTELSRSLDDIIWGILT